jgi:hypothetical protein
VCGIEYEFSYCIVLYRLTLLQCYFLPTLGSGFEDVWDTDVCRSVANFLSEDGVGLLAFLVYFATLCQLHRLCRSDISCQCLERVRKNKPQKIHFVGRELNMWPVQYEITA